MIPLLLSAAAGLIPLAAGHASIFHPSMWGFNVTAQTFPYDNRPVAPLINYTFDEWWFHGHLDYPPNDGDFFELPAGQPATTQIACDKGATTFFASDPGGNIQNGDDPCPGSPPAEYHTTGLSDVKGCSLAITYQSNVSNVQPEDFTVFSVNQTCVWTRFTDFQVPERMPPCPEGGCICAFFWIHSPDSGGEQNYMNGFRCNVTGSTSNVALATPQLPRRCGADPANGKPEASPGNCTYGAKQPFYWFQAERNNMFEGTYAPPFYNDLYNFLDGAQEDIFQDSYPNGIPPPSPNSTVVPTPNLHGVAATSTPFAPSTAAVSSSTPPSSSTASTSAIASSSVASSSNTSLSSLSSVAISKSSPVSVSVTTATVVSTLVVTIAAAATSTASSAPSQLAASSSLPLTIDSASFFSGTITLNNPIISSSVSATSSGSSAQISPSASQNTLLELDDESRVAISSGSTTSLAAPSASANSMCKSTLPSRRLRRRSTSSGLESFLEVVRPEPNGYNTPQDRSRLWRLF